jgi:hypothetical protein
MSADREVPGDPQFDELRRQLQGRASKKLESPPPESPAPPKSGLLKIAFQGLFIVLAMIALILAGISMLSLGFLAMTTALAKAWPTFGLLGFVDAWLFSLGVLLVVLALGLGPEAQRRSRQQ